MTIQGPLIAALVILAVAAALLAVRSFQLLYRDFRPKYRGRHRTRRGPPAMMSPEEPSP